ncbi:NUDIX domain-containing protein [Jiangella aurantiaca]|uniref:8-oxo-dGTP diphosphatase n=1 Tax=Jiangella aurantiaca TaxID=2530373 RepID=A0A4R5AJF2_9ACTN|nr:NUDIX domain-containing protein [Jiangella aurantiaca]TDD72938.1 NUDIX domain-containing protein [Jiangella aurantiaca]
MTVEHRVAAAVLVRDSHVLLCHRRADRAWYPDVWDFPGGHVEDGETVVDTVRRECREELGIAAAAAHRELARWVEADEDITFVQLLRWDGTPRNLAPEEHDDVRWFALAEAVDLTLPDPRYPGLLRRVLPAE